MAGNRKTTAQYRANRQALLEGHPDCHWCGKPWDKTFQADHLLEHDAGGDDSLSNLVPSCQHSAIPYVAVVVFSCLGFAQFDDCCNAEAE